MAIEVSNDEAVAPANEDAVLAGHGGVRNGQMIFRARPMLNGSSVMGHVARACGPVITRSLGFSVFSSFGYRIHLAVQRPVRERHGRFPRLHNNYVTFQ